MPVVFREGGLRYFFYSNEDMPREARTRAAAREVFAIAPHTLPNSNKQRDESLSAKNAATTLIRGISHVPSL